MSKPRALALIVVVVLAAGLLTRLSPDLDVSYQFAERLEQAKIFHQQPYLDIGKPEAQAALVRGWKGPEKEGDVDFDWAIGKTAEIETLLGAPGKQRISFSCWPFLYAGSPTQTVEITANGLYAARIDLEPRRRTYDVELEPGTLVRGRNRLRFGFTYAGTAPTDSRGPAVAFDYLAFGDASGSQPSEDRLQPEQRLDALYQPAGTEIVYTLLIPDDAQLEFYSTVERKENAAAKVRSEVALRRQDGLEAVVHSREYGGRVGGHHSISLKGHAGSVVDLVFRVTADAGETGAAVVWRRPQFVGAGGTGFETNVVLIVIDTLRADCLATYGGPVPTPHIDALAAKGVTFENAYSHIPSTGPSHSSMFTSLLPSQHGVLINTHILAPHHFTLAETMRSLYRRTAGVISLGPLSGLYGMSQGFDVYEDHFVEVGWKTAAQVNEQVLPWLRDLEEEDKFFLWAHYSDPHEPYTSPDGVFPEVEMTLNGDGAGAFPVNGRPLALPFALEPGENIVQLSAAGGFVLRGIRLLGDGVDTEFTRGWRLRKHNDEVIEASTSESGTIRFVNKRDEPTTLTLRFFAFEPLTAELARRRYLEEVQFVDRQIGKLIAELERLERLENTLIVLTSDHGEGLGDHGIMGHISQLYNSLTRVPLILSFSGKLPEGRRIAAPVSLIDIFPTILDLLDVESEREIEGRSLAGLIHGGRDSEQRRIVLETHRPDAPADLRALVDGARKFIRNNTNAAEELYDLEKDPEELTNLISTDAPAATEMREALDEELTSLLEHDAFTSEKRRLSEDEIKKLKALGYLQ